ncbi:hypothetical protein OJAV_G00204620 [Oryzias javanicus]|uniref:Uncharacterized protein n=1 Tax=Oryzias javanicus TaxID=123683 RepID=A0A3S2MF21_ORYJA|nr:hypothetical protein OJAV_G00204620 [Oryzias javanicus]
MTSPISQIRSVKPLRNSDEQPSEDTPPFRLRVNPARTETSCPRLQQQDTPLYNRGGEENREVSRRGFLLH